MAADKEKGDEAMVIFSVAKRRLINELEKNVNCSEMIDTLEFYIKEFKIISKRNKKKRDIWMI